ncbi:DNA polymerase III subunit alpha [Microbacteriaceae bacterium 4G12]
MKFVHLQCQTVYSLLKSACKIETLVRQAKDLGFEALAITDENVMYGVIPFYKACKREGIKPIIGLTASILTEDETSVYPLVLLAENEVGYQNLIKISSSIMTKAKNGIPKKWLAHYASGLIAISPGRKGEIEQLLLRKEEEQARAVIRMYQSMFDSFYCSIQHHNLAQEQLMNAKLFQLSEEMNVQLVVTNDVQYVEQKDAVVHECLLSIESGTKLTDEERPRLETQEYYLKAPTQMHELFSYVEDALENTAMIAQRCNVDIPFHTSRLPKFPIETKETSDAFLRRVCEEGLHKRYVTVTNVHKERLAHELQVIERMGFSDYFLIVWDFMKYAHSRRILTGPGRGSAAGSLVAYVLEITDVDPIAYQLLFERFLNPERISLPDIDIDFPDIRRDEVIRYVATKYGQLHVAQIITFGTLAAKAAVRDVARAMGLSQKEMDWFSKLIPSRAGITLTEAYSESTALQEHIKSNAIYEKVFHIAKQVEGLPRHTSIHAAGVIISDCLLTDSVAIQEGHDGVYITQYPAEVLEELGLLKMDFLGLRNLTLLENICHSVAKTRKETIDLRSLPLKDKATFELLGKGDTTGIFQLESAGMRKVLSSLKPTEFEDIVAVNALYRPGPMEQIPVFIESKHKKRSIAYLHPDLEPILQQTYGVIVYQEQIMQIASQMAGFSLGEADLLRRAVSKKNRDILDQERHHFVQGCLQNGYEQQIAEAVYDLIVRFANYGFNRSHAVAYSMIAYQLAYLKANYPLEFMSALLSSVVGNEEKIVQYIREAKRRGLMILPPSIQVSGYRFHVDGHAIRYSLLAIRSVGMATVKEIIQERNKRPFTDLFDFCVRLPKISRKTLETLISAGCFDDFKKGRASLLASVNRAVEYAALVRPDDESQMDMFLDEDLVPKPSYEQVEEMPLLEKLNREKDALGFYLSSYPTYAYEKLTKELHIPTLVEAMASKKTTVRSIVCITEAKTIRTKKMQKMAFLTICDEGEELEAVVFPDTYLQFSRFIQEEQIVLLEGMISERNGKTQWVVNGIYPLDPVEEYEKTKKGTVYIKLPSQHEKALLATVTRTLFHYPGYTKVLMYYEKEHKMLQLTGEFFVHPNEECMRALQNVVGQENAVLKI